MAGLLGDIYSAADSAKRRVYGLLGDPVGTAKQFVGMLADDARNNTNISNAAWDSRDTSKLAQAMLDTTRSAVGFAPVGMSKLIGPLERNLIDQPFLKDLISSQRYLDRDIVARKIRSGDFNVKVTPEFSLDGDSVRAITDGHHALEAAIRSGNNPNFITETIQSNDRVGRLLDGDIGGYLESAYHDSPWYNFATKRDLF